MKFLHMDSPFMNFLSKIADVIIINLLTILMCIPVITVGAAFTAMHYCCLKIIRGEESSITKQYFHSFKDNFKQSTIIWIIMMIFIAFFGFDFLFLYSNTSLTGSYVFWGLVLVVAVFLIIGSMVYPIQAKFANSIPKTLKFAFVYSFRHLFSSILIVIVSLLPFAGMYFFMGIFPLFLSICFSGPALFAALLYNKQFKKLEDKYLEAHPEDIPSAQDEHIFDDEAEIAAEAADAEAVKNSR